MKLSVKICAATRGGAIERPARHRKVVGCCMGSLTVKRGEVEASTGLSLAVHRLARHLFPDVVGRAQQDQQPPDSTSIMIDTFPRR